MIRGFQSERAAHYHLKRSAIGNCLMDERPEVVAVRSACAVRPALPRDSDAMADLARQLGYECTGEEVRRRISQMQDPSRYAVLVAELSGDQIAGWIGAHLFRCVETPACVEISGLVVHREVRSRGIGEVLLHAAEKWARSVGCEAITVRSNVTRDGAHRFYLTNGYEHVKTQNVFRKRL